MKRTTSSIISSAVAIGLKQVVQVELKRPTKIKPIELKQSKPYVRKLTLVVSDEIKEWNAKVDERKKQRKTK